MINLDNFAFDKQLSKAKNRQGDKHQRLFRRRQVAALYLQGKSQCEIATILGTRQPTVCLDLKRIREEWLASCVRDFDEAVAEELAKLNNLEAEAWAAFERSCQPSTATQEKVATNAKGVPVQRVVGMKVETGAGDPRYLERISWCVLTRLRLLGYLQVDGQGMGRPMPVQINWDGMLQPESVDNRQANGQVTREET